MHAKMLPEPDSVNWAEKMARRNCDS